MAEPIHLPDYQFYAVAKVGEVPPGQRIFITIGDEAIILFNIAGQFFAISDVCTHDDGQLGDGELEGYQIICPRHGARFDVRDGRALSLPAMVDTLSYPVIVTEDDVEVGVPER